MIKFLYSLLIFSCLANANSQTTITIVKNDSHGPTFRHHNGYMDYSIVPEVSIQGKDSVYINELRFTSVRSAMFTQQLMFDRFGKWTKVLKIENKRHPALLWEKVKLFDDSEATYDVSVAGIENSREMYSSVMIFNSENNDCLAKNAVSKESLINYFSEGLKKLKRRSKFYDPYWTMFNEYSKK